MIGTLVWKKHTLTYLNIVNELAEGQSEEPRLGHILHHCSGQAEQENEQVGSSEVHNKHVRHCPTTSIAEVRDHAGWWPTSCFGGAG